MSLLLGKPVTEQIKQSMIQKVSKFGLTKNHYVAIIFLGDDYSSSVYVKLKKKYGESLGIGVKIFTQTNGKKADTLDSALTLIEGLNGDKNCIGIIVQLPLPEQLKNYKAKILSHIDKKKDIDGLGGILTGLSNIDYFDFIPATPKAVFKLLEYYKLGNYRGKNAVVIGQSNLVGKPLTLQLIKYGAEVLAVNSAADQDLLKYMCKQADYIISCTGVVHLIDKSFVNPDKDQVIIDVGYGHLNGKPVGDVNFDNVKDSVKYITPVPGGIGPITVACLFDNIFDIMELEEKGLI